MISSTFIWKKPELKGHFIFREALPRLDNYRLSLRALKRPSISLLHGEVLEHISVSERWAHETRISSTNQFNNFAGEHELEYEFIK